MPQLGETVVEGTITKWLKKEGETVDRDEPLFEISTDKVDTEVPSPVGGKIVQIKVPEGETVSVGTELALIEAGGDGQVAAGPAAEAEVETAEAGTAQTARVEEEREEAEQAEETAPREVEEPERGPAEETESTTARPEPEEERRPPAEP